MVLRAFLTKYLAAFSATFAPPFLALINLALILSMDALACFFAAIFFSFLSLALRRALAFRSFSKFFFSLFAVFFKPAACSLAFCSPVIYAVISFMSLVPAASFFASASCFLLLLSSFCTRSLRFLSAFTLALDRATSRCNLAFFAAAFLAALAPLRSFAFNKACFFAIWDGVNPGSSRTHFPGLAFTSTFATFFSFLACFFGDLSGT